MGDGLLVATMHPPPPHTLLNDFFLSLGYRPLSHGYTEHEIEC